jgi:ABC-type multidrug transport system fused ATPase/permease subunit
VVFSFQVVLLALGLGGLSLSGLGVDVIRAQLQPGSAAPRWPLGFDASHYGSHGLLFLIGFAVLAMAAVRSTLNYSYSIAVGKLIHIRLVPELRTRVFDKLQRLSFRFFDENATGSIINRVTSDVQSVRAFVDGVLLQGAIMVVSLGVYLVYMLYTHALLTAACLALTPLLWLITNVFSRRAQPAYAKNRELVDQMVLTMSEGIVGMQVIKVFGGEQRELARFQARNAAVREQQQGTFRSVSRFHPTLNFVSQLNIAVLLLCGGWLVIRGELSLGGLIVFAGVLQQFASQVSSMAGIINTLQQSLISAQRVFEVLDAPLEVQSPAHPLLLPRLRGDIRFEDVHFRHHDGAEVLSGLDFEIRAGQCVAIVGATGSGKSTLLGLIPRFHDVTRGRILIDGVDVRQLDLDFLRRQMGLVFQESLLFNASVAQNIAFGAPNKSREAVERAAKLAGAQAFIDALPEGYDTVLSEGAQNLSGGQRQRIAIARAMILEPPVLLLDDPTTAVDPETERDVLEAMEGARQGRTTLIVANRLSTLRRADLILVLEGGKIVERGSHDELLTRRGPYYRAAALQAVDEESLELLQSLRRRP